MRKVMYNGERRINFNDGWRFQRETEQNIVGVQSLNYDDSSWRKLDLPHDWSIELDFNPDSPATHEAGYLDGGIGWYRKTFAIPSSMEGKQVFIDFDGVYMDSTTYLNGELLGTYPFGYNAFTYNITDKLYTDGRENVLVVKVNNKQPSSRWYSGSGIYRNVYLTITNSIHVARYGTFVTTPDLETTYAQGKANVNIKTKIHNASNKEADIKVKSTIFNAEGEAVSTVTSDIKSAEAGTMTKFEDQTMIASPELWDINNPYRYHLVTEVVVGEEIVDTYETRFGARYFEFDPDEGFSLNGQYMKLHGVSMHHDLGALGAATNARAVERQMQMMKDMGVNSIRVTHNPASPELLEAANNLGLLVVDEAFDSWEQAKKTYDYSRFFTTWAEHDVKEMVDRGKNEPSIIMWSIGNEIYDTTNARGVEIAKDLVRWVKEIDTTRPTTIGEDKTRADKVNVTPLDPYIKEIFDTVDIVGLNYSENNYAGYHEQNPNWKIYGAETSSATRSRGVYTHPYEYNQSTQYDDLQQSSYDNDYVAWGRTAEDAWKYDRDLKHIAGQYIWTGFDYIGEPTPYYHSYPAKSSYFGAVDTAGFPKDIFYYYQSQWKEEPMLHILPHWNWTVGETVRVLVYTNASKVELFLNGKSLGERHYDLKKTSWGQTYKETTKGDTYLEWAVPFESGTLYAVAKDENGEIIVENEIVTAGKPVGIRLTPDERVIVADSTDLSFVTVEVVDKDGNVVPTADHNIQFNISGEGILAGVDNGDAASIERYKDHQRRVFSGKALAIIQSNQEAGEITLEATASGLTGNAVRIYTVEPINRHQKKVAGIDMAMITIDVQEIPQLPETVQVYYSDSTSETKQVTWEKVDPTLYATIGRFTVIGTVEGTDEQAELSVIVRDVVAVTPTSTVTKINASPELPSTTTVIYSDETKKNVDVVWDEIIEEQLVEVGHFVVEGNIQGTDLKTKGYVRVTDKDEIGRTAQLNNITINDRTIDGFAIDTYDYELTLPYGSELPKIEATATDHATVTILPVFPFTKVAKIYVHSEDGRAQTEYTIHIKIDEPKLVSAELLVGRTEIVEDEIIELNIKGKLENNEQVDLTNEHTTYEYDPHLMKIIDHQLYALEEGQAELSATVVYKDVTITTSPLILTIAKNPAEKFVESIEPVVMTVDKEEVPTLPQTVTAHYNTGLPREVQVIWEAIDAKAYKELGEFTVTGTVDKTSIQAVATIMVKGAVAVENTVITVLENQVPELPKELIVYFSDGTERPEEVIWREIPLEKLTDIGVFKVAGDIVGCELKAIAQIRVTNEIGSELNISRFKNGYDYPKAEASFTNKDTTSADRIEAIHDDLISYGNNPHNRWTNFQEEHRPTDWVSITFGDYEPEEYNVDNIEIHWFEDQHSSYPGSYKIQYKSEDQWIDVTGVQSDPATPTVGAANYHTFDMVKTSAIRVLMTAQPEKALAITELKIFAKWPQVSTEPKVTDLIVDGKSVLDDCVRANDSDNFHVNIKGIKEISEITALGSEDTSITIVPTVTFPSTARVIATSEDGKKTIEYHIHLN